MVQNFVQTGLTIDKPRSSRPKNIERVNKRLFVNKMDSLLESGSRLKRIQNIIKPHCTYKDLHLQNPNGSVTKAISQRGDIKWPPRSSDLTPMDFLFGVTLKVKSLTAIQRISMN